MAANSSSSRPACDNCKSRKTKCDRGSPCSSCVVAELACRITHRAPEKRQRVLLSTRYDEAMENVDHSLQEVSETLQQLLRNSKRSCGLSKGSSPTAFIDTGSQMSSTSDISEGYRGNSSFKAHVKQVADALGDTAANLEFSIAEPDFSATMSATHMIQDAVDKEGSTAPDASNTLTSSFQIQYPELEGRSLPPIEPVLKILWLSKTEKQRFFIDVPIIDELEFGELCQKVYFAIQNYLLSTWAIVNTGLFYLFLDLEECHHSYVGVTPSDIQENLQLLSANLEATIRSLRLCEGPSIEGCQALALLTSFSIKSGWNAMAWSLITSASRMCIDMGLHCLPPGPEGSGISKKKEIFWHVYVMDKGMAFTLGRTPSIPQYDVATERPSILQRFPGSLGYVYTGFVEFAVIVGDMHIQLFSTGAQRESLQSRTENAKSIAAKLIQVNSDIKKKLTDDPPIDTLFKSAGVLLDIIMHCLITIAYRIVPCNEPNSHPLQCNAGCIEAARQALSAIVRTSQTLGQHNPVGWSMFLNLLFSLVPFACFVVLAGNTVASSSTEDLELLSAAVSAIEPVGTSSRSGRRLYDVCRSFHRIASLSVVRQAQAVSEAQSYPGTNAAHGGFPVQLDNTEAPSYEHIMAPQYWDAATDEFGLGFDVGAMAAFIEPYVPFDR